MTKFLDGPAAGVVLMLGRSPRLLRVVRKPPGEWDALDQLGDEPDAREVIHVYRIVSGPYRMHINRSRRHGGCGWLSCAEYRAVEPQPSDAEIRTREAWRQWARANDTKETT